VPDEVIEAVAAYLRESNANLGGAFERSRRSDLLVDEARRAAAGFLGCGAEEVAFGANMTTLNFAFSRSLARELRSGDEIVVTKLDHDGNVAPWLELADDVGVVVRFAELRDDTSLDTDHLASLLTERTRVVAFPWASNAVGTLVDVARVAELAHSVGALAWVDAVHYAPHGPIDVCAAGADVLLCSPYKFFGPHLGLAFARAELLERWRPYKVRPSPERPLGARFETGTLPHELLAGFVAAVRYVESVGYEAIVPYERELGARFLAGLPESCHLHGLPTMDGRVPTFCLTLGDLSPDAAAERLAERGVAVWSGDYYAVEVMNRLGLPDGALRAGIVHYNTAEEVDRLLAELERLE
jgi:cysteine desulfurase family protein (TIGR01976 family)